MHKSTSKTLLSVLLGGAFLSILLPITLLSNNVNLTLDENTSSSIKSRNTSKIEKIFTKADADLLIASKGLNWDGNLVANDFIGYTSIGDFAFVNNQELKAVTLSDTIITIGIGAFFGATGFTTIDLPAATGIGDYAFMYATSLTTIDLPAATGIGDYAFMQATSLTTIDLPAATSIGDGAFQDAIGLTTISLPAVVIIGKNAFKGTTSIVDGGIKLKPSFETNSINATFWGTTSDKIQWFRSNNVFFYIIIGASVGSLLLIGLTVGGILMYRKKTQGSTKSKGVVYE